MSETNIISNQYRTHSCGELNASHADQSVRLSGWVHSRRDHGGLIFIDLRDRQGITQIKFDPSLHKEAWQVADTLRSEYVIAVSGIVRPRPQEMTNDKLSTGEVEIEVDEVKILSAAKPLPFEVAGSSEANEDLRLRYRFIDLRRPKLQELLQRRDRMITFMRNYMHDRGFTEVQTPILANSSPEGARDFLVPSRLHPGQFYALPQAPQQFKQLLMVAGVDRYFQIAPCFRDEDPRADRHPGEFYQLDMEMSFVEQEDVFAVVEPLMVELTAEFSQKKIVATPFPRLSWHEAMEKFGSDKPDLRYGLEITPVTQIVKDSGFKVFSEAAENGVVHALRVPGGAKFTRQQIDQLTEIAKSSGGGGLAYILYKDNLESPIIKYLGEDKAKEVAEAVDAKPGDAIFFGAGAWLATSKVLGAVRVESARMLNLLNPTQAAWCWVVDFPMYEKNPETGKIDFNHNPFSMPQGGIEALASKDPLEITAYQYDLVLNGYEILSGAIRNHEPETMYKAFEIAGYTRDQVDQKFGGMLRAFEFGAPPHGGCAPGIDRLMMVLWDVASIRDIYAFPKNGRAQDVLMGAPSVVDDHQLKDLHIKLDLDEE